MSGGDAPRGGVRLWTDAGLLVVLSVLALAGLAPTFLGWQFLLVGVAGVVLGTGCVLAAVLLRLPTALGVLAALLGFLLLGGPLCLRSEEAWWPVPRTWELLLDRAVLGWKELLTTLPPVDPGGPLLVLPWLLGLLAGVLGMLAARHTPGPAWLRDLAPVLVPLVLLGVVILVGVRRPQSLLLQGGLLAVLALGWLALRAGRRGRSVSVGIGAGRAARGGLAVAMLVAAGLVAWPLAGIGSDEDRLVLRQHVEPPFEIGQYPSPLSAFRRYVKMPEPDAVNVHDETLFTLDGAPEGARVRIATLNAYDGVVWRAAENTQPGTRDTFRRVSSVIENPARGEEVSVDVTIGEAHRSVWLPTVGALQSLRFSGEDAGRLADEFRYNLATRTGVVPPGLEPGDEYSFTAVRTLTEAEPDDAPYPAPPPAARAAGFLDTQAGRWSAGESEPMRRVFAIAKHLKREGKYSDGVLESEKIYHAGHHVKRLLDGFASAPIAVGNDEQYAAAMALLANNVGVPARVVLGAVPPESGEVRGEHVRAWVELRVADGSWRVLPQDAFMDYDRPAEQPPQTQQEMSGVQVPPPAPVPPPSTAGEQTDAELNALRADDDSDDEGWQLPVWLRVVLWSVGLPLLVLGLLMALVVGAKAWRRRRRREAAAVSHRVVGGWREVLDRARDLRLPVAPGPGRTRREQVGALEAGSLRSLARQADATVFGPQEPSAEEAGAFWESVDAQCAALGEGLSRRRRWWAAVSPVSLLRRS